MSWAKTSFSLVMADHGIFHAAHKPLLKSKRSLNREHGATTVLINIHNGFIVSAPSMTGRQ
jgi:hypothetical protein